MCITYGNNSAVLYLSAADIWNLGQEFADPTGRICRKISVTHLAILPEMLANRRHKDNFAYGDIHKEAAW